MSKKTTWLRQKLHTYKTVKLENINYYIIAILSRAYNLIS